MFSKVWDGTGSGRNICACDSDCAPHSSWLGYDLILQVSFLKYAFIVCKYSKSSPFIFYAMLNLLEQTNYKIIGEDALLL